jgi:4-hydroxybenzoyl-CoA reductase subunit beta
MGQEDKMRMQPFVYLEPKSLKEALVMLSKHKEKLRILSGGTETVALLKLNLINPQYVMSLKQISSLKGIQKQNNKIVIGGATTLREMIESPLIRSSFKGIVEAARSVGAPQIQNIGTIAGNILQDSRCLFYNQSALVRSGLEPCLKMKGHLCRAVKGAKRCFSVYQGDLAPMLIAFKAKAKLQKKNSSRTVYLSELFSGNGKHPFNTDKDELLTKIILPVPENQIGSSYQKLRMRGSIDYPLASVASVVNTDDKGNIVDFCVVVGAVGSAPKIVPLTSWKGKNSTNDYIHAISQAAYKIAEGVNNQPLSGLYRRKMIKVLTKRAFNESLKDKQREQ